MSRPVTARETLSFGVALAAMPSDDGSAEAAGELGADEEVDGPGAGDVEVGAAEPDVAGDERAGEPGCDEGKGGHEGAGAHTPTLGRFVGEA